ncbi:MAG: GNAT family N-acetyltransferase [Candidatus Eremiobacteraeota bacterium]|nr:GNAT family N-acetyltransferase [Candidatus Eremiobacteraeota bacterium]
MSTLSRTSTEIPTLRTERLRLEPLSTRHSAAYLDFYERNRAHLEPWEPARDEAFFTLAHQQARIAEDEIAAEQGSRVRWIMFDASDSEIVADIALSNIRRGVIHAATLGYAVDAQHQGRGYATEAAVAVVRFAFDVLNLHRLETGYQPQNDRSGRVLRKLGFLVEGYARDYLLIAGAWRDSILVSLTNDAWQPFEPQ